MTSNLGSKQIMRGLIANLSKEFAPLTLNERKSTSQRFRCDKFTKYIGEGRRKTDRQIMVLMCYFLRHHQKNYLLGFAVPKKKYDKRALWLVHWTVNGVQKLDSEIAQEAKVKKS